jgi:hypothetical protein
MTGFSRRHVIRVVKSLIYERGKLRVDKRVMRPGRNAINVYHVVNRDVTTTEKGIGIKTGRSYWIPGSYVPTLSENRNSFLKAIEK